MKKEDLVTCPKCDNEFPLAEAVRGALQTERVALRAEIEQTTRMSAKAERDAAVKEALREVEEKAGREKQAMQERLKQSDLTAEKASKEAAKAIEEQMRAENALKKAEAETAEKASVMAQKYVNDAVQAEVRKVKLAAGREVQAMQNRLNDSDKRANQAREDANEAIRKKTELVTRIKSMPAEVAEKAETLAKQQVEGAVKSAVQETEATMRREHNATVAALRAAKESATKRAEERESQIRAEEADKQQLTIATKEKTIGDLRRELALLQSKATPAHPESEGEVLEQIVQSKLERSFVIDGVQPIPKGVAGADILQEVRDDSARFCGRILWEVKNAKLWQKAWLGKLKNDQQKAEADIAVIVSDALPPEAEGTGFALANNGVWITGKKGVIPLATALRVQLKEVSDARAYSVGKEEKMDMLYKYLTGPQFKRLVESIGSAYEEMKVQLEKERAQMGKHWATREKHLNRVLEGMATMRGDFEGIVGKQPALDMLGDEVLGIDNDEGGEDK